MNLLSKSVWSIREGVLLIINKDAFAAYQKNRIRYDQMPKFLGCLMRRQKDSQWELTQGDWWNVRYTKLAPNVYFIDKSGVSKINFDQRFEARYCSMEVSDENYVTGHDKWVKYCILNGKIPITHVLVEDPRTSFGIALIAKNTFNCINKVPCHTRFGKVISEEERIRLYGEYLKAGKKVPERFDDLDEREYGRQISNKQ
jgi:hypothetical protein